ncbi:hypothetical protein LINPERHAP1_LOCUS52 [Linum perenne]
MDPTIGCDIIEVFD